MEFVDKWNPTVAEWNAASPADRQVLINWVVRTAAADSRFATMLRHLFDMFLATTLT